MFETHVTVVGNVITTIGKRRFDDGTVVANFRVASTERRYDRDAGTWCDGDRLFVDVNCRRTLAQNAIASLVKGDPVVVTGKLYTRNYEHEGQRRSSVTLEAHSIAADLCRCTAVLTRTRRGAGEVEAAGDGGDRDGARTTVDQPSEPGTHPGGTAEVVPGGGGGAPQLVAAVPGGEG